MSHTKLIIARNSQEVMHQHRLDGFVVMDLLYVQPEEIFSVKNFKEHSKVCIGDLAKDHKIRSKLLKVIEEAKCQVVCVSSIDAFDATFLSRFLVVEKAIPTIKNTAGNSLSLKVYLTEEAPDKKALVMTGPSFLPLITAFRRSSLPAKRKLFV